MGKYTSLARQLRDEEHNKEVLENKSVKINNINVDTDSNTTGRSGDGATPLRPYAVDAVIQYIHGLKTNTCGVCSGYARWLIEDEGRLRRAQGRPHEVRREFWGSLSSSQNPYRESGDDDNKPRPDRLGAHASKSCVRGHKTPGLLHG